jgi:FG-GAP repeat
VVLVAALILGVACGLVAVAVSASLRVVAGKPLGIRASAGGYSRQAELTGSASVKGGFGSSVALSAGGSTALVGTSSLNGVAGAVYVFTRRGGTWSRTAELTASGTAAEDDFGSSVALSAGGSTALVGAPGRNSYAGAVYVFTLRGGTWSQAGELTASDAAAHDQFGASVALSAGASTALVGAPGHNSLAGAGYVFTLRGGTWSQAGELTASRAAAYDFFGDSVALSAGGGTALVGAPGHNENARAAYVFTRRGGTWSQAGELTASGAAADDSFGWSVALSAGGSTALVGAFEHDKNAGAGYVFARRDGTWSQAGELTASGTAPGNQFGASVALSASGSTALVGAVGHDKNAGAGYVFTRRGGTWSQTGELTASGTAPGNQFGASVALSAGGSTALVGAIGYNSYAGAGYVFTPGGGA